PASRSAAARKRIGRPRKLRPRKLASVPRKKRGWQPKPLLRSLSLRLLRLHKKPKRLDRALSAAQVAMPLHRAAPSPLVRAAAEATTSAIAASSRLPAHFPTRTTAVLARWPHCGARAKRKS